jgi:hypothetical protein
MTKFLVPKASLKIDVPFTPGEHYEKVTSKCGTYVTYLHPKRAVCTNVKAKQLVTFFNPGSREWTCKDLKVRDIDKSFFC